MPFVKFQQWQLHHHVAVTSYGDLRIPRALWDKHTTKNRLQIYIDEEKRLIGLQPDDAGYLLGMVQQQSTTTYRVKIIRLTKYVAKGRYPVEWNQKHEMFTFQY